MNVGIWIRVSTETQAEGDSPEHHLHRAQSYAKAQGWSVVEVYRMDGVSGRTVHEHPEMARMQSDVKSGRIQGLIFSSLTRLARSKSTLWAIADLFEQHNANLICLDMAIDTSTPAGELVFSMFSALAEFEAQLTAERVSASVLTRAERGKSLGGVARFGFQWSDGKLEVNEAEAPILRLMFELFAEHQKFSVVARELNKRGYKSKTGKQWSTMAVRHLIVDPGAKGQRIANKYNARRLRKSKGQLKSSEDWITVNTPAIVSPELWDRCNDIIKERQAKKKANSSNTFAGLLECGRCRIRMYADHRPMDKRKYWCKQCRNNIHASTLDAAFKDRAWAYFDPNTGEHLRAINEAIEAKYALMQQAKRNQTQAQCAIDRADDDYISGALSAERYEALSQKLEQKKQQSSDEYALLLGEIDALKSEAKNAGVISDAMKRRMIHWDDLNQGEQKQIAHALVERMQFSDNELIIEISTPDHRHSK